MVPISLTHTPPLARPPAFFLQALRCSPFPHAVASSLSHLDERPLLPAGSFADRSRETLKFAQRCSRVTNYAVVNETALPKAVLLRRCDSASSRCCVGYAVTYSDEQVANREIGIWHLVTENGP
jgi:hypothetical protein